MAYSFIINVVNTASGSDRTQGWQDVAQNKPGKVWGLIEHCRPVWMVDSLLSKVAFTVLNKKGDTPIKWKSEWVMEEETAVMPTAASADDFLDCNLANMEAEIEEMLTDAPADFTSDMIDYLHNTERTITGSLLELDWSDADDKRIVLIVNNVVLSIGKAINELKKL